MRRSIWAVTVLMVLGGCGSHETVQPEPTGPGTGTGTTHTDKVPPPSNPPPPMAPPTGARITDEGFELAATTAPPFTRGTLASIGITLTSRGNFHVNQEFPISVEITAPQGLTFPKTTLERPDAAEFSEARARFDVPFTPQATGEHRVEAKVSFAVCTPENCYPDERTLSVVVPVS